MNINFKTNDNYYSGLQKFNILADRTFRGCLLAFILLTAMQIPAVIALPPGMHREIFFILAFLAYMLPAAFVIAGGMSPAGWRWYAAAAALYAAATVPVALGASFLFLLLIPPALLCFMKVNKIAPHLLIALGYKTTTKPATEIIFTILVTAILITYSWLAQALIKKSGYEIYPAGKYIWFLATSALYYGTLWGIMHGLLMRRFLDMRYEIAAPIALNTFLLSMYWIPSVLGYSDKTEILVGGAILQALASQMAFGMVFYFCRSTRPLMAAYAIYYLFLKSIIFI